MFVFRLVLLVLCLPVLVGETLHDPGSLSHLKREILFLTCTVWCIVIICDL